MAEPRITPYSNPHKPLLETDAQLATPVVKIYTQVEEGIKLAERSICVESEKVPTNNEFQQLFNNCRKKVASGEVDSELNGFIKVLVRDPVKISEISQAFDEINSVLWLSLLENIANHKGYEHSIDTNLLEFICLELKSIFKKSLKGNYFFIATKLHSKFFCYNHQLDFDVHFKEICIHMVSSGDLNWENFKLFAEQLDPSNIDYNQIFESFKSRYPNSNTNGVCHISMLLNHLLLTPGPAQRMALQVYAEPRNFEDTHPGLRYWGGVGTLVYYMSSTNEELQAVWRTVRYCLPCIKYGPYDTSIFSFWTLKNEVIKLAQVCIPKNKVLALEVFSFALHELYKTVATNHNLACHYNLELKSIGLGIEQLAQAGTKPIAPWKGKASERVECKGEGFCLSVSEELVANFYEEMMSKKNSLMQRNAFCQKLIDSAIAWKRERKEIKLVNEVKTATANYLFECVYEGRYSSYEKLIERAAWFHIREC